jgi:excisionase family DNA binding protein
MEQVSEDVAGEMLLTIEEVAQRLAVSPRTVYRMTQDGYLPKLLRVGKRSVRWRSSEIEEYIRGL